MAPSESDILAVRLTRMKRLIDNLERACAEHEGAEETFRRLRNELKAVRDVVTPPAHRPRNDD